MQANNTFPCVAVDVTQITNSGHTNAIITAIIRI